MKKTNKKENKTIIPRGIVLMNNKGEKFSITEKSNTKKVLKKIIEGYNKIYSIKEGKGVEKSIKKIERIDDLLACKFQGEKKLHVMKFSKLLEVSNLYTINYVGNLKLVDYNYETDEENYDLFKINRRYYRLEGVFVNKTLITLQNLNIVEKLISDILNNFEEINIRSIVVRDIDSNKLKVMELKKIDVDFEMGIPKINMKIKGYKNIKRIDLNEYSILFEMLYNLASIKIEYFTDA